MIYFLSNHLHVINIPKAGFDSCLKVMIISYEVILYESLAEFMYFALRVPNIVAWIKKTNALILLS
jgi:hypothetical protein